MAGDLKYTRLMNTNETPITDLRARLIRSVTEMLGELNGQPPSVYTWVWERWDRAPITDLAQMQTGWMRNYPELHARHGIFVF